MQKVNVRDVPEEHRQSPGGLFELRRRHVSLALGGVKDVGPWGGGHPFDVELSTLPPGKSNFPLHSHAAQTEYYLIVAGSGLIETDAGESLPLVAGDHVICHPGEAHKVTNDGTVDLVYYILADHHRAEITSYPNTGKRQLKPEYRIIQPQDADYYSHEE